MPGIATFESKCASCHSVFAAPWLGEFAYGEFVLTGMRGNVYALLTAIGNEAWDLVQAVVPDVDVDTFQELLARLADPVNGQSWTMSHVCPRCESHEWTYWGGDRMGNVDVPNATFNTFLALQPVEREQRALQLLAELTE